MCGVSGAVVDVGGCVGGGMGGMLDADVGI